MTVYLSLAFGGDLSGRNARPGQRCTSGLGSGTASLTRNGNKHGLRFFRCFQFTPNSAAESGSNGGLYGHW
jgi:hypothetical protein